MNVSDQRVDDRLWERIGDITFLRVLEHDFHISRFASLMRVETHLGHQARELLARMGTQAGQGNRPRVFRVDPGLPLARHRVLNNPDGKAYYALPLYGMILTTAYHTMPDGHLSPTLLAGHRRWGVRCGVC